MKTEKRATPWSAACRVWLYELMNRFRGAAQVGFMNTTRGQFWFAGNVEHYVIHLF